MTHSHIMALYIRPIVYLMTLYIDSLSFNDALYSPHSRIMVLYIRLTVVTRLIRVIVIEGFLY